MRTLIRRRWLSYGGAVCAVAVACALTLALPQLREQSPFPLFFGAVALAAWLGGSRPALWATCLSVLAIDYFFVPPAFVLALGPDDAVRLGAFAGVALLISALQKPRGRFLTVCAVCRRVREQPGVWVQVESYLRRRVAVECSHGLCPECARQAYPQAFPNTVAGDAGEPG
jgi:hypothetical protein